MSVSIHPLSDADLVSAADILKVAFQRAGNWIDDLRFNRGLQPDGHFGAYQNSVLVGMVGSIIYSTYAYVGLMAIHPDYQRQGVGSALMGYLLTWLAQQNVHLVFLDASKAGQPLYEKLGFVAYDQVFVLQRRGGFSPYPLLPNVKLISTRELNLLVESDAEAFGADRSRVLYSILRAYSGRAFMLQDNQRRISGYLFAQRNRIGPWVMQGLDNAEALLLAALSLPFHGDVSVVVPGSNREAIDLLQRYEFQKVRVNQHMARGIGVPHEQNSKIFGKASLSLG
jgi:ribosomal protein S18 acetylase RimI-like enzyme